MGQTRDELNARITGGFWERYHHLVREQVIPYQWRAMNDEVEGAPKSHSVENFRVAAGRSSDSYEGMVFQDSDLYKWLEAVGNIPADEAGASPEMQAWVDEAVELIEAAQREDGYLNTYFIANGLERRWTNLRDAHELYCAGHLIEAAVALDQNGRGTKLLEVARRFADLIDATFGSEPGKKRGYPGHEEIELALLKLYHHTGERRYLDRARYFIDERGREPYYFDEETKGANYQSVFGGLRRTYYQAHRPFTEQREAVGHAVRAMYLYIAAADLARESGDRELIDSCDRLWENTTNRKMYVTGSIGSSWVEESFGAEYDLPNDTAYAETCAAIGLFLFSSQLLRLHHHARYADVMERCLYNGILSGLALDGEGYFYVNPLEVIPQTCDGNPSYGSVKYRRQPWYGCACCPPNIARTLTGLPNHLYHLDGTTLYLDLYHQGSTEIAVDGHRVSLGLTTEYPWSGRVTMRVSTEEEVELELALRIPGWCAAYTVAVNGAAQEAAAGPDGYLHLSRSWGSDDTVELDLEMEAIRLRADRRVAAAAGKIALQRGPVVYCLEEADNGLGLNGVRIPADASIEAVARPDLLGGVTTLVVEGTGVSNADDREQPLYAPAAAEQPTASKRLTLIPYYAWANRSPGEMSVWIRE